MTLNYKWRESIVGEREREEVRDREKASRN